MKLDRTVLIHYVFILGAIMTGVYIERIVAPIGNIPVLGGVLLAGLVWLGYYRRSIVPRIEYATESDEAAEHEMGSDED